MKKRLRQVHRWLGLVCSAFLLLFSLTALALNHQTLYLGWLSQPGSSQPGQPGAFAALAADPFDARHLLASDSQGLFASRDGGARWQALNPAIPTRDITLLAFSGSRRGTLALGQSQGGLFLSEDGGQVWEDLALPDVGGEPLRQLSFSGDQLLLTTRQALHRYHLVSQQWESVPLPQASGPRAGHLTEWIYQLHTGRFFGTWGVYLYDAVALAFIFLALSGLVLFRRKEGTAP